VWPIDIGKNYSNVATNIIKNNKHFSKRFFCLGLNFEMVFLLGCDSYKEGHMAFLTAMFMLLSCLRKDLHLFAFMDYYCIVHGKGHSMVMLWVCEHGEAMEQTFVQIDVPTFQHLF